MSSTLWKIALRTLARDKTYALLNLAGLVLATACCLMLGVYLRSELTYDRSHVNHDRIFRVVNEFQVNGKTDRSSATSPMLGQMLKNDNADVQAYVRFMINGNGPQRFIRHGDLGYYWDDVYVTDPNVFDVFTHETAFGDPKGALDDPLSAAVSRSFARKYFGNRNPVGEAITVENGEDRMIRYVFEDLPQNTHLKYDVLFSSNQLAFATPEDLVQRRQRLFTVNVFTYLLMPAGYDAAKFDAVQKAFYERNMTEIGNRLQATWHAWLQPLTDIHLYSDTPYDRPTGNRYYLYGFMAVAVFTLLVACINYMNLATARAAKRAKEIGIKKILGSSRSALIGQFLAESMLLAAVAVVLGVALVGAAAAFTPLDQLFGKTVELDFVESPDLIAWVVGLALVVGLGAGLYPALYLASIVPASALVGGSKGNTRSTGLREALVFVQFVISITVIACTLVMASQMRYMSSLSLGFEKENRMMITMRGVDLIERAETVKAELLSNPNVLGVTWSDVMPGQTFPISVLNLETNEGVIEPTTLTHAGVGPDFVKVMGMQIVAGRDLQEERDGRGIAAIVVNEATVRAMHWDAPLGKRFEIGPNKGTVVGVIKDFNYGSLHDAIAPFALHVALPPAAPVPQARPFFRRILTLNVSGNDVAGTVGHVRRTMGQFDAEHPFEFQFLDDSLDALYVSDQRLVRLIGIFSGLCIFIACLGLFGLAAFSTAQRTREIGVRKVFGARTGQIIALLAHKIVLLVVAASMFSSLFAYLVMTRWLEGFAFRTSINPLTFVVAMIAGLAIAYATVVLQSMKAARAHPVRALRYE